MYKIMVTVLMAISMQLSGQSKIQISFGVSPYTYYFSEKLGDFNVSIVNPLPTYQVSYKLSETNSILLKRSLIQWRPKGIIVSLDTSYLEQKAYKIISLGLAHDFKIISNLDFQVGTSIIYVYGIDSVVRVVGTNTTTDGYEKKTLGLELFGKLRFEFMRSMYVSPTFNLNITADKGLNLAGGIIMLEFDF